MIRNLPWVVLSVLIVGSSIVEAQTTLPDAVSCPTCRIELTRLAQIGSTQGPGVLSGPPGAIARDSRGRYWITQENSVPMVFNANGRYVTAIGSKGGGPGEFQMAQVLLPLPGDSMLVLDPVNHRATILDPGSAQARVVRVPQQLLNSVIIRWPDRVVSHSIWNRRGAEEPPIAITSFANDEMKAVARFGVLPGEKRSWFLHPILAVSNGGIWWADSHNYRLRQSDSLGATLRMLQRRPKWFPWPVESPGRLDQPNPHIGALAVDTDGLIWVFVLVAAPDSKAALARVRPGSREVASSQIDWEKLHHTRIEVIDPSTNRVLVRNWLRQPVIAAWPDRRIAIYTTDADGNPQISIAQLTIRR